MALTTGENTWALAPSSLTLGLKDTEVPEPRELQMVVREESQIRRSIAYASVPPLPARTVRIGIRFTALPTRFFDVGHSSAALCCSVLGRCRPNPIPRRAE